MAGNDFDINQFMSDEELEPQSDKVSRCIDQFSTFRAIA